jgi:hypothetical protein
MRSSWDGCYRGSANLEAHTSRNKNLSSDRQTTLQVRSVVARRQAHGPPGRFSRFLGAGELTVSTGIQKESKRTSIV